MTLNPVTASPSHTHETKDLLLRLMNEGKHVEATSERNDITKLPHYFDQYRFKRAQTVVNKYYSNLSIGSTTGLLLLVQNENILLPLLKTGKSRTVPDLCDRYVMTAKYIRKCYETDFHDPTSDGYRYIVGVRAMHRRIHSLMNNPDRKASTPYSGNELSHPWVNQYDMALTQFAFVGLFLLEPRKCAAYNVTTEEFADITYYWCLISYYFGIEDRFNIFVYYDDIDQQLDLMRAILKHQNDMLDKPRREVGVKMAEGIMLAFEDLTTELSFNILDHWWSPTIYISGQKELKPYTLSDKWKLISFFATIQILFRIEVLRTPINYLYKRKFDKFCKDVEKTKQKLAKKYQHMILE